jgi:hypothetical protein
LTIAPISHPTGARRVRRRRRFVVELLDASFRAGLAEKRGHALDVGGPVAHFEKL